jgi:hypothetical protein
MAAVLRLFAIAALLAPACTQGPMTLDDFKSGTLSLELAVDGSHVKFTLGVLSFDNCPTIESRVQATLDGAPLDVTSRGTAMSAELAPCEPPAFEGTPSATPLGALAITDGKTTISATIANLGIARAFSVGTIQRGATARFTWSVDTDSPQSGGQIPATPYVQWTPDQGQGFSLDDPNATLDGTTVVASIPANAATGAGMFSFNDLFGPAFVACSGVSQCHGLPTSPPGLHATISP